MGDAGDAAQHWIDAGLYDPAIDTDGQRRELLAWFDEVGIEPESFVGIDPDDLPAEANRRLVRQGPLASAAEAREHAGMSAETFDRIARASGWPDDLLFTELDLASLSGFTAASEIFSPEELLHFVRVLSSTMGRLAEAATALFRIDVGSELESRGGREVDWAKSNHEAAVLMDPIAVSMHSYLLIQLTESARRSDAGREQLGSTGNISTLQMTIGFVDIVGYTEIAESLAPDELGSFIQAFEARAYELVTANNGRVVKLIGDEVMFATVDPHDACRIARQLLAAFADEPASPSAGIAHGEVIARGGDFYGRTVNLAARMADLAVPNEVLVDKSTADASFNEAFDPAGRRQLKGFAEPLSLLSLRFDS